MEVSWPLPEGLPHDVAITATRRAVNAALSLFALRKSAHAIAAQYLLARVDSELAAGRWPAQPPGPGVLKDVLWQHISKEKAGAGKDYCRSGYEKALSRLGERLQRIPRYRFDFGGFVYEISLHGPLSRHQDNGDSLTEFASVIPRIERVGTSSRSLAAPTFQRLTFSGGRLQAARFVPGEQRVLFAAAWNGMPLRLFSARWDSPGMRPHEPEAAGLLAVSPSTEALALGQVTQGLFPVGTLAARPIGAGGEQPIRPDVMCADFAPDGRSMAVVSREAGEVRLEYPPLGIDLRTGGSFSCVRVSRDGTRVALIHHPHWGDTAGAIAVVGADNRLVEVTPRVRQALGLAWAPKGSEVWVTVTRTQLEAELIAVDVDTRQARRLLSTPGQMTLHDVEPGGDTLLSTDDVRVRMMARGPAGGPVQDLSWLDWSHARDISHDGSTVLFEESGDGADAGYAVFTRTIGSSFPVRRGDGTACSLSPDGRWALVRDMRTTPHQLQLLPLGPGQRVQLSSDDIDHGFGSWLPDSSGVVFGGHRAGEPYRLFHVDVGSRETTPIGPDTVRPRACFPVTHDGLATVAQTSNGVHLLIPISGGRPQELPGLGGDDYPIAWGRDGLLYLMRQGEAACRVWRCDPAVGQPVPYIEEPVPDRTGFCSLNVVRVSPATGSFVYSYMQVRSVLFRVTGLDRVVGIPVSLST